ncbi:MAG: MarR family winged helix-turn-helix transcriptional regulator [Emergencia sp.]
MDYLKLAQELAEISKTMLKIAEYRKLSDSNQGEGVLLGCLRRHGGEATPAELSGAMKVSSARIAVLLNKMEQKGLVVRQNNPASGRSTIVRLLPEGRELSETQEADFNRKLIAFFEMIGEEKAVLFVELQKEMMNFMIEQSGKEGEDDEHCSDE